MTNTIAIVSDPQIAASKANVSGVRVLKSISEYLTANGFKFASPHPVCLRYDPIVGEEAVGLEDRLRERVFSPHLNVRTDIGFRHSQVGDDQAILESLYQNNYVTYDLERFLSITETDSVILMGLNFSKVIVPLAKEIREQLFLDVEINLDLCTDVTLDMLSNSTNQLKHANLGINLSQSQGRSDHDDNTNDQETD